MRVLICGSLYLPGLNGQAVFTRNLAEALTDLGHRVTVLTTRACGRTRATCVDGVTVVPVPTSPVVPASEAFVLPFRWTRCVRAQIDAADPDVIHVQDPSPLCQAAIGEGRRRGIPVIATHHIGPAIIGPYARSLGALFGRPLQWLVWRAVLARLARADVVTVPSQASVSMLSQRGLENTILRAPCPVRLAELHPEARVDRAATLGRYGLDPARVTLIYVGRVDAEKRVEDLIRGLAALRRNDVQLAIAGQGALVGAMRRLAQRLGVRDSVHFLGQIGRADLPALLHSADIFAMPGDAESFSIATVEAMACGRVILAADASALPELVTHGEGGYLFRPRDPEDLAHGIQSLIDRRAEWTAMGATNALTARRFDLAPVAAAYERAYAHAQATAPRRDAIAHRSIARRARVRPVLLSLLLIAILAALLAFSYEMVQAIPPSRLDDLIPIDLRDIQRLLVVAPHPDDESLGAAGIIQAILQAGGSVRVVVVANGDGQAAGPLVWGHDALPSADTFVRFGLQRQQETLDALATLGVSPDMVFFLGYPDGKLGALWESDWAAGQAAAGRYTRVTSTPYDNTTNQRALYRGGDLFDDLVELLAEFGPDLLVVPHPEDTHEDHRAVSSFARFAAAYVEAQTGQPIGVLGYLVHYDGYPVPRGTDLGRTMLPPAALSGEDREWLTYILSDAERVRKYLAIQTYGTQQRDAPTSNGATRCRTPGLWPR